MWLSRWIWMCSVRHNMVTLDHKWAGFEILGSESYCCIQCWIIRWDSFYPGLFNVNKSEGLFLHLHLFVLTYCSAKIVSGRSLLTWCVSSHWLYWHECVHSSWQLRQLVNYFTFENKTLWKCLQFCKVVLSVLASTHLCIQYTEGCFHK